MNIAHNFPFLFKKKYTRYTSIPLKILLLSLTSILLQRLKKQFPFERCVRTQHTYFRFRFSYTSGVGETVVFVVDQEM